jgi:hypothetical protein
MDKVPRDVFYIICGFLVIDIPHVVLAKRNTKTAKTAKTKLSYMTRKHRWLRMLAQTNRQNKILTYDYRARIVAWYGDDFLIIEKKLTMSQSKHKKCVKRKKLNKKKQAIVLDKIVPLLVGVSKHHIRLLLKDL